MTYEQLNKKTVRSLSPDDRKYAYVAIAKAKEKRPIASVQMKAKSKIAEILQKEQS